ncbi:MAG: tRNA (cytidine(34)-2'-O)-methyltransferase, partial [Deferribacterales bacterium]
MFKIALYEPEIPQNTGNIARLCAGTNTELILIGKLGFSLSNKYLKRAGLDYWEHVILKHINNFYEFEETYPKTSFNYAFLTKFSNRYYTEIPTENTILIFGNETSGLPEELRKRFITDCYRIPINNNIRSLNLANSAAIVLYDLLRKID